jgi:hypothetical protein
MVYPKPRVNIEWLNLVLKNFAEQTVAVQSKIILLVMDRAGWHRSERVVLPSGIYVEYYHLTLPNFNQQKDSGLWLMNR